MTGHRFRRNNTGPLQKLRPLVDTRRDLAMRKWTWSQSLVLIPAMIGLTMATKPAAAIPAFASQTGQSCTACHIGGFGPQLTPVGRAFKIGGYTQGGGEGWAAHVPLAAMAIGSFTHTDTSQPEAPA